MASGTSTTFPVSSNIKINKYEGGSDYYAHPETAADDIAQWNPYNGNNCSEVLQMPELPRTGDLSGQSFIDTVVDAYSYHHNLVIRPDDVWAVIMSQFSFYISKNAQDLRDKFKDFEGKEAVTVAVPESLKDLKYAEFIKLMSTEVEANVTDPELKDWILPKFSTTTDSDTVTIGLTFKGSVKEHHQARYLGCGIPNVTLEGTAQDWQDMLDKVEKLKEYKLDKWYDLLKPVIQEFANAKGGTVDTVFWKRICHYEPNASATFYLSGWITVFTVFDKDGNWIESNWNATVKAEEKSDGVDGDKSDDEEDSDDPDADGDTKMDLSLNTWLRIDMEKIPSGLVEVNVNIKDESDVVAEAVMMAGHLGVEIKDDEVTIQPILGCVVALKSGASDKDEDNYADNYGNGDQGDGADEDPDDDSFDMDFDDDDL